MPPSGRTRLAFRGISLSLWCPGPQGLGALLLQRGCRGASPGPACALLPAKPGCGIGSEQYPQRESGGTGQRLVPGVPMWDMVDASLLGPQPSPL